MTSPQIRHVSAAVKDLGYIAEHVDAVVAALVVESSAIRGAAYDGARIRAGISDPTAAAALAPNKSRSDLDQISALLASIARDAAAVAALVAGHRPSDPKRLQRELGRLADTGEPGCQVHARIGVWTPPNPARVRPTTVADVLDEPLRLCRPCEDFVRRNGRTPTRKELRAEQRGGKLRPLEPATS